MLLDNPAIDIEDVRIAIKHNNAEKRANATIRLSRSVKNPKLSREDRLFANKTLQIISNDVSELVRRALAVTLKNSTFLPRAVVKTLLEDIESVAVPLITHSPLLDDEDLKRVIQSGISGKIQAVSGRRALSERIVFSLIRSGDAKAVRKVAANDDITISETAAKAMVDVYREDDLIKSALMQRASMPMPVVEKLVAASADDIANRLITEKNLVVPHAQYIARQTYERTTTQLANDHFSENTLKQLVIAMNERRRLTPSLIMRAMGLGKIGLVHYGLAALAAINVRKAVLMFHDKHSFSLRSVCAKAGFTLNQTEFMLLALKAYKDLELSGKKLDARKFQLLMIERVLTLPIELNPDDKRYFLNILDGADVQGF